jgi:putative salt-induced outer membrane protein
MKNMQQLAVVTLAVTSFTASVASHAADEKKSPWTTRAELGYVVTSGNSETSTINAKIDATHEKDKWRHNIHAEALGASTTDQTTNIDTTSAERYQLSGKSDYKFNETDYMFGTAVYDKDRFSGFEYQSTIAAGYGRRVINDTDMTLDLEVGPGVRVIKIDNAPDSDSEAILRLAAKYLWKLSDTSEFTEDLSVDAGSDLTVTKSVTALTANINSTLAMKISLTIKNNSEVPLGSKKTDTQTAVTLVYSF